MPVKPPVLGECLEVGEKLLGVSALDLLDEQVDDGAAHIDEHGIVSSGIGQAGDRGAPLDEAGEGYERDTHPCFSVIGGLVADAGEREVFDVVQGAVDIEPGYPTSEHPGHCGGEEEAFCVVGVVHVAMVRWTPWMSLRARAVSQQIDRRRSSAAGVRSGAPEVAAVQEDGGGGDEEGREAGEERD